MRRIVLAACLLLGCLLCPISVSAQSVDELPDAIDAEMDGRSGGPPLGTIPYGEPVSIGQVIPVCVYADTSGPGPGGTYPVTDDLGNTYVNSSVAVTPGIANITNVYFAYTTVTVAGTPTITIGTPAIFGGISVARFNHLSGVIDVDATATTNGTVSVATLTTSLTTTVNNDLLITCAGAGGINDRKIMAFDNEPIVQHDTQGQQMITQSHTGAFGLYTQSVEVWGSGATFGMVTAAFKSTPTIYLADTALPDAASGQAYSAQLNCVGGVAAQNYTLVSGSLPTGLSLSAAGKITGTAAVLGTTALGFQCDDGSSTSATNTLDLTVGALFNTVTVASVTSGDFDLSSTMTVPSSGSCYDVITLTITGDDISNRSGFLQATSGTNNYIQDSFGSPVKRIMPHGGAFSSPLVTYMIGPIRYRGPDVLTIVNNQGASSGNEALAIRWTGAQAVVDYGATSTDLFTGASTLSTSLTTPVDNEMAVATSMHGSLLGGLSSFTMAAPFVILDLHNDLLVEDAAISPAGTVTEATSFTSINALDTISNSLFALRPALVTPPCSAPRHRVQFQ